MQSIVDYLFGAASFMPHGYCLLWRPDLVALHAISDGLIFLAYASIPAALVIFVRRRPDLEHRWTLVLFASFIMACGLTHLVAIVTLWQPAYGLQGLVKLATAIVSVLTAIAIWPLIPKLLKVPSPTTLQRLNEQLAQANTNLKGEIAKNQATLGELSAMRRELEVRVELRTRELAVAYRDLERVNDDLSTFVHVASHDLKEPLRGIHHFAEMMIDDHGAVLPVGCRDDLGAIARLADRMNGLIDALRTYTRAGSREEVIEDLDLDVVLDEAKDNLAQLLNESGMEIDVRRPLPNIRCARVHVLTVLQNLIANACHHATGENPRIVIEAEKSDAGVLFRVSDNGPGIPLEAQKDVFKMFYRLPGTTQSDERKHDAMAGMGLAIVKRIVDRYNGTITLNTSASGGVQFELILRPA